MNVGALPDQIALTDDLRDIAKQPATHQSAFLERLCSVQAATSYGSAHGFADIEDMECWRRNVPVMFESDLRSLAQRMLKGDSQILVNDDVLAWNRTSGTTGEPKLIPVTQRNRLERGAFKRRWHAQSRMLLPGQGKLTSINLLNMYVHESGVGVRLEAGQPPVRAATSGLAKGYNPWIPECCYRIDDYDARYEMLMRFMAGRSLRRMIIINPSTLVLFERLLHRRYESMVRDIADGTIADDLPIDVLSRQELNAALPAMPDVARDMDAAKSLGTLHMSTLLPTLEGIGCWRSGGVVHFSDRLGELYGVDRVMDLGYHASEGLFSIPVTTHDAGTLLDTVNTLVEFLPADDAPPEPGSCPETIGPDALEVGKRYWTICSGFNGLYRWWMNDIIDVVDFVEQTPRIRFLCKGGRMNSTTGEKMDEYHVAAAASRIGAAEGIAIDGVAAAVCLEGDLPHYVVALESDVQDGSRLSVAFDEALKDINPEYRFHRGRGAVEPVQIIAVAPGRFEAWRRSRIDQGASEAQVKPPGLFKDITELRCAFLRDRWD